MTYTRQMMSDPDFDPHGKDWGTALFIGAFGSALPPEEVNRLIKEKRSEEPGPDEPNLG